MTRKRHTQKEKQEALDKRNWEDKRRKLLANELLSEEMLASFVMMSCARACYETLVEKHGWSQVEAETFVKDMVPLAVAIGSDAIGAAITPTIDELANLVKVGSDNAEKITEAISVGSE